MSAPQNPPRPGVRSSSSPLEAEIAGREVAAELPALTEATRKERVLFSLNERLVALIVQYNSLTHSGGGLNPASMNQTITELEKTISLYNADIVALEEASFDEPQP